MLFLSFSRVLSVRTKRATNATKLLKIVVSSALVIPVESKDYFSIIFFNYNVIYEPCRIPLINTLKIKGFEFNYLFAVNVNVCRDSNVVNEDEKILRLYRQ